MDKVILDKKVDSILRCLNRIETRMPNKEADFFKDYDAQDVVVLNLTRAIQMSVDIATHILASKDGAVPETMAGAFVGLQHLGIITGETANNMCRSVSFRNVAVHAYDDIDMTITYAIAHNHLDDFKQYISQILSS